MREYVAGLVSFDGSHSSQTNGDATGKALQLVRRQRRIGRDDHDDRALFRGADAVGGSGYFWVADWGGFSAPPVQHRRIKEFLDAGPLKIHFPCDSNACDAQLL